MFPRIRNINIFLFLISLLSEMYISTLLKEEMFCTSVQAAVNLIWEFFRKKKHICTKILKFEWKFLKANNIWWWKQEIPLIILCIWLKMDSVCAGPSWTLKKLETNGAEHTSRSQTVPEEAELFVCDGPLMRTHPQQSPWSLKTTWKHLAESTLSLKRTLNPLLMTTGESRKCHLWV